MPEAVPLFTNMLAQATTQSVLEKEPSSFFKLILIIGMAVLLATLAGWAVRWFLGRLKGRSKLPPLAPPRLNILGPVQVLIPVALWFVGIVAVQAIVLSYWGQGEVAKDDIRVSLLTQPIVQLLWIAGCLAVAWFGFPNGLRYGLGVSTRHWIGDLVRAIVTYLAILPLCIGAKAMMVYLLPESMIHTHPYLEALPKLEPRWKLMLIFSAVVMAALSEELFFRGLLQSFLRRHMNGWLAILVASGVFTLFHAPMVQDLPSLFILAIALGYAYERTGRLFAPIFLHALFNAISIGETLMGR